MSRSPGVQEKHLPYNAPFFFAFLAAVSYVDTEFSKGDTFATIESVKAASEIYMPISGKVVEINEQIVDSPELLNDESFEDKWFVKVESEADQVEFADLLDYSDYKEEIE